MATLTFAPAAGTHRTASGQVLLKAAATALTASYVATTNDVITLGWEYVIVSLGYTEGDETTVQIKPQIYDGTTWQDCAYKATQGSTVSEITPDVIQLTAATFATAYGAATLGNVALPPIPVIGAQKFRLLCKATGGTPTGTLLVTASAGNTVKFGA